MARTRRQITLQEQESGVPASPPQSLPTATRSTRVKRTTARSNTTVAPTDPSSSTRGAPAIRGSRIGKAKRAGRGQTQTSQTTGHDLPDSSATDVDGPEASDSLTQTEVAVQTTTRITRTREVHDNHDEKEGTKDINVETSGETQSPTGVLAHPVQGSDALREHFDIHSPTNASAHSVRESSEHCETQSLFEVSAHPVQESTTPQECRESATSMLFRDIVGDRIRSPTTSPAHSTPQVISPSVSLESVSIPHSETSTPTEVRSPSTSPRHLIPQVINPTASLESTSNPPSRTSTSSRVRSPSVSPGHLTPHIVTPTVSLESTSKPPSVTSTPYRVSPSLSSPSLSPVPEAPRPASHTPVYYMPSHPEYSQSLITIYMNYFQGSKDPVRTAEPAAFAVPSELIAPVCRYIESRAKSGSDLSKLTTDHPAVNAIVHGNARYQPPLPAWQSQQTPSNPGSTLRDAFMRKARRKRGYQDMEEETATLKAKNASLKATPAEASTESPPKRTKTVADPWTADGQLQLGVTKEIEVDENGIAINPLDEPNVHWYDTEARKKAQVEEARRLSNVGESPYLAEEIPDADGPALGGIFAESQAQNQPDQVPETPRARGWNLSSFLPSARSVTKFIPFSSRLTATTPQTQPPQVQQLAQTEPRINASNSEIQRQSDVADTVHVPGHRHRPSRSNQQKLLTKQQSEEEKRIKKMRAYLRREADALEKQREDLETAKKDLAEQQKLKDVASTPGEKRKRMPSPDVIPLPASGGFGMVDEYFVVDSSSDEGDATTQETPTKERPLKKARTSAPNNALFGNPFRARPYTGTLFAHPDASRSPQVDKSFTESDKADVHPAPDTTPPAGPTLTFKVPSPGSSDSDGDEEEDDEQGLTNKSMPTTIRDAPAPKSILRNSKSNQSQSHPITNPPLLSKPLAPPPRPNPSHATLPTAAAMTPSDALEKAREKALKHQPKQPSTLRESSRLSSSTMNSDPGDQENVEEYDPAHPAIVSFPGKVAAPRQPSHAESAFGQPIVESAAPNETQQPAIRALSEQSNEQVYGQQAVPSTQVEQPETAFEGSTHANDVLSNDQPAVPAQEQARTLNDTERNRPNTDLKIKVDLDRWWKEHGDEYVLGEGFKDFEEDMLAEEQELMDSPNEEPYVQPRNIISAALDRVGAEGLSDSGRQTRIEENWRPGDLERTANDPENGMRVFFDRMVENGGVERDLADRVIAMGVPPGITEYLAGQDIMGPVAV